MPISQHRLRTFARWLFVSLLFAVADFIFSWNPVAAGPYFAVRHLPAFRLAPLFELGFAAELVNGAIALWAFRRIRPALTGTVLANGSIFGLLVWGFWVVSGTLSAFIWLDIPASLAAVNLLFGLPKCLFIGVGIASLEAELAPVRLPRISLTRLERYACAALIAAFSAYLAIRAPEGYRYWLAQRPARLLRIQAKRLALSYEDVLSRPEQAIGKPVYWPITHPAPKTYRYRGALPVFWEERIPPMPENGKGGHPEWLVCVVRAVKPDGVVIDYVGK